MYINKHVKVTELTLEPLIATVPEDRVARILRMVDRLIKLAHQ